MTNLAAWRHDVGELPYKVTVLELLDRDRQLYLRWRPLKGEPGHGNWKHEQLKEHGQPVYLRTANGRIKEKTQRWAIGEAKRKLEAWKAGQLAVPVAVHPLTLREGLALATDPERGKYPVDTPHRRELTRSLQHAMRKLGAGRPWESITMGDLRALWRDRIKALREQQLVGHRSAQIVIRDVLSLAAWLRAEKHIPATACVFDGKMWKDALLADWRQLSHEHRDPEVKRPRHTVDELRRILAAAPRVDPRLGLALELGAEGRLGQVLRSRRTDLNRSAGEFTIWGVGHKKGTVLELTAVQRQAVERALTIGYLRELEAGYQADGIDYPLFPAGRLAGTRVGPSERSKHGSVYDASLGVAQAKHATHQSIDETAVRTWFHEAEALAGVPNVRGRGWYGLRRAGVDGAAEEGISREGMQEFGGWADSQVPDRIYRDRERKKARGEAARTRATIRGEDPGRAAEPAGEVS